MKFVKLTTVANEQVIINLEHVACMRNLRDICVVYFLVGENCTIEVKGSMEDILEKAGILYDV